MYYYYYYYHHHHHHHHPCYHFMRSIYSYIPETNHVYRLYMVAAVLYLLSVLHVMLFRPWNMFCTFTLALPPVSVLCPIWLLFCSSLISCFPGMLLRYCLSALKWFQSPLLLLVSFLLSHSTCADFLLWVLYFFISFSASIFITFLSTGIIIIIIDWSLQIFRRKNPILLSSFLFRILSILVQAYYRPIRFLRGGGFQISRQSTLSWKVYVNEKF